MAKFEKVKIAGQELNIKFGFNALAVFEKESGESISGLGNYGENIPIRVAICLVYAGLKDGARVSKSEFKLTKEDVADLLDDDGQALNRVMKIFSDMMGDKKKAIRK
tara:strand:+ start:374 stop:694 length:321 start_codon:yes stop_codon:yes gene_type:complete